MKRALEAAPFAVVALCVGLGACQTDGRGVGPQLSPACVLPGPSVKPVFATLHPGDTLRVTVSGSLEPCRSGSLSVSWSSSDSAIASVDASSGLVHARRVG